MSLARSASRDTGPERLAQGRSPPQLVPPPQSRAGPLTQKESTVAATKGKSAGVHVTLPPRGSTLCSLRGQVRVT